MNQEQSLLSLRSDLKKVGEYLKEIAEAILDNEISEFPLFIVHRERAISLGRAVVLAEKSGTYWSFNASMLEELVGRGIIQADKVEEFRTLYKDARYYACIFMLTPETMNVVFSPFLFHEEEEGEYNDNDDAVTDNDFWQ